MQCLTDGRHFRFHKNVGEAVCQLVGDECVNSVQRPRHMFHFIGTLCVTNWALDFVDFYHATHIHSTDYAVARCPSVHHTPVLCLNGYTYSQNFFTTR